MQKNIDGQKLIGLIDFLKKETEKQLPGNEWERGYHAGAITTYMHIMDLIDGSKKKQKSKPKAKEEVVI